MRPLRTLGTVLGLAVAFGVIAGRAALTPVARRAVVQAQQDLPAAEPADPGLDERRGPPGAARARRPLGLLVLCSGRGRCCTPCSRRATSGSRSGCCGAILLNDLVVAPVVTVLRALSQRAFRRLPEAALAWLKGGFVVGGVLVLVVVPEIWAQHLGTANPTVLPGDYAGRLLVVLVVVAGLTLLAVGVTVLRRRGRPRAG